MKILVALLLTLSITENSYSQNCNCETTFKEIKNIVEQNYPGWQDKVTTANKLAYQNWSDKFIAKAKTVTNDSTCYANLKEWIGFFKDKHLSIRFNKAKPVNANTSSKEQNLPIEILKSNLTTNEINEYLKSKKLNQIEGIYESSSYKLAVIKVKSNLYHAVVLSSTNENWKEGDVKLVINEIGSEYNGNFYDGYKEQVSTHKIRMIDNILDFDVVFYEKTFPATAVKRDIKEYEIMKDDQAPKLSFVKNDLAVFTFPNFYGDSYDQLAYLLKKYESKLSSTSNWIIDLRDNDGGDYQVGMQLMKYLYTKPIIEYNTEMRMTESNFNLWYNSFVKYAYENASDSTKKKFDELFSTMKNNFGTMYNRSGKLTDTLTFATSTEFPKKIGVIINQNTVSSGELFTILAKQSDKVKVFGTNSGGMMDYGNVVNYKMSCPTISLRLPIARYLWLDKGFSVDREGLIPDVYLKDGNLIDKVYDFLNK